jgi:hypothetical protein
MAYDPRAAVPIVKIFAPTDAKLPLTEQQWQLLQAPSLTLSVAMQWPHLEGTPGRFW